MVNYKNNGDTVDCVRSLSAVTGIELPWVVVVDNGTQTSTLEAELCFYPRLKVLHSRENLGFGKANNRGIAWATTQTDCEFIFLLNNDTLVEADAISQLIKAFSENEAAVLVAPKIVTYGQPPRIWYGGGFFDLRKVSVAISHLGEPDKPLPNRNVDFASGCAMLFRAGYFRTHHGFDPHIFMYDEDVELCLRIKMDQQKILFVGAATVYHKCQGSQRPQAAKPERINQLHPSNPNIRFYLNNTIPNRYYIANKYFRGLQKAKIKTCLTAYWLLKTAQYLLHGRIRLVFFTVSKVISN